MDDLQVNVFFTEQAYEKTDIYNVDNEWRNKTWNPLFSTHLSIVRLMQRWIKLLFLFEKSMIPTQNRHV